MAPDLFRLKLVTAIALVTAIFLCAYATQRLYYYLKTRRVESIDTIHFHPYPDGVVAIGGILFVLAAISGITTMLSLRSFSTVEPETTLLEFDVASVERGDLNLSLYSAIDIDTPFAKPSAVHFLPGETFEVVVEEVQFRSLLSAIGQPKLVRPVSIRGLTLDPSGKITHSSNTIELGGKHVEPLFPWLYQRELRVIPLSVPAILQSQDVVALSTDAQGKLSLVLERRTE